MRQKLFGMSDNVASMLEKHAKENKTSQSKVVEVAVSIYLAMHSGAEVMAQRLKDIEGFKKV